MSPFKFCFEKIQKLPPPYSMAEWLIHGKRSETVEEAEKGAQMKVMRRKLEYGEAARDVLDILLQMDIFSSLDRTHLMVRQAVVVS